MRWRWRKTIGMGPFRTTVCTRGVGWSVGIPGFRYGISPTGRRYISVGIPGTGLYGIQYLTPEPSSPPQQPTPPAIPAPTVHAPLPHPAPAAQATGQKWWQQK
jgi:hypothetical protein